LRYKKLIIAAIVVVIVIILPLLISRFHIGDECHFNDNLIGSAYSKSCFSSDSSRLLTFKGKAYIHKTGRYISDVYEYPVYAISHFSEQVTDQPLLSFEKTAYQGNLNIFRILDVLLIPKLQSSEVFMYGHYVCKMNGEFDDEIIAIAKNEEIKELKKIVKSWRVNKLSEKFESISVRGISCEQDCVGAECD
jgi:hypothetical protein